MPLRLKTTVWIRHQRILCYFNARPKGLAEKHSIPSGQIVSSWLLHVSLAQRHQGSKTSLCKGQIQECSIDGRERGGVLKKGNAVHAASPKTSTLRSLFTSFSHESIGRSEKNQYAQGHREALVTNFCIECQLKIGVNRKATRILSVMGRRLD